MALDNTARKRTNAAYELEYFDNAAQQVDQQPIKKVVRNPQKKNSRLMVKTVGVLITVVAVCSALLYSRAVLTEVGDQITTSNETLEELQSEGVRLKSELDSKLSLDNVEEYALNELDLVKMNAAQKDYVTVPPAETVQEEEKEESFWDMLVRKFEEFREYIGF